MHSFNVRLDAPPFAAQHSITRRIVQEAALVVAVVAGLATSACVRLPSESLAPAPAPTHELAPFHRSPMMAAIASTSPSANLSGTTASFAVLGAATVTNTGATVVDGNLGLSPGSAVTGFPPGVVNGSVDVADAVAAQGQVDLDTSWSTLKNEPCDTTLSDAELGELTLTPGVYCFTSPAVTITGDLVLDSQGDPNAVFVFQIASTLTTASNASVTHENGGNDCNVFWEVGSSATLGTNTSFAGTILASTSITATTGASVSGRLLAHTGAVTLDDNHITVPTCGATEGEGEGIAAGEGEGEGEGIAAGEGEGEGGLGEGEGEGTVGEGEGEGEGEGTTTGECTDGEVCCGDGCVNLQNDDQNCGACGNHCALGDCCDDGVCTAH